MAPPTQSAAASAASTTQPPVALQAAVAGKQEGEDAPILAAMLAKRAQGRSHFGRLNWKQRWFELRPGELSYWTVEGGRSNPQAECKGVISLDNVHAVEFMRFDAFNKTHMFQVVHNSVLYVQCNNKEECERWVKALRKQVMFNEFLHPKYHPGMFEDKEKRWTCCHEVSKDVKGCQPAYNYQAKRNKSGRAPRDKKLRTDGSEPSSPVGLTPPGSKRSSAGANPAGLTDELPRKSSKPDLFVSCDKQALGGRPLVIRAVNTTYV